MKGIVKVFFEDKGYGFIKCDTGTECFFHMSGIENGVHIEKGNYVAFDEKETPKGKQATNITIIPIRKFIKIGEQRIKISNIKEYRKKRSVESNSKALFGMIFDIGKSVVKGENEMFHHEYHIEITTFQNEIIKFTGNENEIDSIIKILDER